MFKPLILVLLALATYGYSEEASKLSPADQAAIDKAIESSLNEPSKAYQAYQAALTKASEKAIKDLEKLKAGAMKGNNLPLAVAIDGKIAEVKKGALGSEVVGRFEKTGDLLGGGEKVDVAKNDPKSAIVGKWKRGNSVVTMNADGTFVDTRNIGGKWTINKDGSFSMTWSDSGVVVACSKPVKNITYENGGNSLLAKITE